MASQGFRTPVTPSSSRNPGGLGAMTPQPSLPSPSSASSPASARATPRRRFIQEAQAVSRKRSRRRVFGNVQVPSMPMEESAVFNSLVDLEQKLDQALSRRRRAVLSTIHKPHSTNALRRTLRVWVYNLHFEQPIRDPKVRALLPRGRKKSRMEEDAQDIDRPTPGVCKQSLPNDDTPTPAELPKPKQTLGLGLDHKSKVSRAVEEDKPNWVLRVQGRLLPDSNDLQSSTARGKIPSYLRFSRCIDRVVVELDPEMYTDHNVVEWRASEFEESVPGSNEPDEESIADGFELKRVGCVECVARIMLYPTAYRHQLAVVEPLRSLLGVERATRTQLLVLLWTYIHTNELLDLRSGETVNNDEALKGVFGVDSMELSSLALRISQFLAPLPPIILTHHLQLNGSAELNEQCFDIELDVEGPLPSSHALPQLDSRQLTAWNAEIDKCSKRLEQHRSKRDFMMAFSYAPLDVINTQITSQAREAMAKGNSDLKNAEEKLHHQSYYQPWIHEAVLRYLNDQLRHTLEEDKE